jgi:hypothetical protein
MRLRQSRLPYGDRGCLRTVAGSLGVLLLRIPHFMADHFDARVHDETAHDRSVRSLLPVCSHDTTLLF